MLSVFVNWRWRNLLLALGLLTGLWTGFIFVAQENWPLFPPVDSSLWWVHFLPLLALFAAVKSKSPPLRMGTNFFMTLCSGIYLYLLTTPIRTYEWSTLYAMGFCGVVALGMGLLPVIYVRTLPALAPASAWPLTILIAGSGSAYLFLVGSSAKLQQYALFLVLLQILPLLIFLWKASDTEREHYPSVFGLFSSWFLLHLWVNSLLFSSLSGWGVLTVLALLSPLMTRLNFIKHRGAVAKLCAVGLCALLCTALGIGAVLLTQTQAEIYY